jgi:DNA processing protein
VLVVSGGAYGIDVVAHRAALAAAGHTVLVSAGGLDRPYPSTHAGLFAETAESGLLVSESPPGAAPHRHRFLTRNRLIAALSTATVVIEAASRSGALNTAAHARALSRVVMAVPGPVTSAMSAGCHQLLQRDPDPAVLVTNVDDVLAVVGEGSAGSSSSSRSSSDTAAASVEPADAATLASPVGPLTAGRREGAPGHTSAHSRDREQALDALGAVARQVYDGLPARGWVSEDRIARLSGVDPRHVIQAITALRGARLIEGGEAGFRVARPEP